MSGFFGFILVCLFVVLLFGFFGFVFICLFVWYFLGMSLMTNTRALQGLNFL